jgi:type IV secretory pathway component VirB8
VTAAKEALDRYDIMAYTVVNHPSYNAKNLKNDISIIKLTTKAPLGKLPTISNICMPSEL